MCVFCRHTCTMHFISCFIRCLKRLYKVRSLDFGARMSTEAWLLEFLYIVLAKFFISVTQFPQLHKKA